LPVSPGGGPANVTGTVGIKPTLGLPCRDGIAPVSLSFDVTGPVARTVEDAAIALQFMAGVDANDPRTLATPRRVPRLFLANPALTSGMA